MDVSIIIVNYKTPDLVIDCIKSVKEKTQGLSYEIIVVDNDSQDGSLEQIEAAFGKSIQIIDSGSNLGFGKANNLGAKYATGKHLFLLNSDTVLVNNAIKILFDYIETHKNVGVVGGNLYTADLSPSQSYASRFDEIADIKAKASWHSIACEFVMRQIDQRVKNAKYRWHRAYGKCFNFSNRPKSVAYIIGADMMIRKQVFDQVQGFDKRFFMYAEEEEMTWRIQQQGYKSVSVPAARIIHYNGRSSKPSAGVYNLKTVKMKNLGRYTYYMIRFGRQGLDAYYEYTMKYYDRIIRISKLLHREKLEKYAIGEKKLIDDFMTTFLKDYLK